MKFFNIALLLGCALMCRSQELSTGQVQFVARLAADTQSLLGKAEIEDRMDTDFDPVLFEDYMDKCFVGTERQAQSLESLVRKTSDDRCSDEPIDTGDRCKNRQAPSRRYGYNKETGLCEAFMFTGCGGNDNNFEQLEECQWTCEDPCDQPLNNGTSQELEEGEQCESESYYYYNKNSRRCQRFEFSGCGGNKNRFESFEECRRICRALRPAVTLRPVTLFTLATRPTIRPTITSGPLRLRASSIRGKRAVSSLQIANRFAIPSPSVADFCTNFTAQYPEIVEVVNSLDLTNSPDVESALISELDDQVTKFDVRQSPAAPTEFATGIRRKRALLGFLNRPIRWARVTKVINSQCREYRVTIRIFCMKALVNGPSTSQKNFLCNLMKQGIKKHWEVPIVKNGVTWPVRITVKEGFFLSKKVVLKYFTSAPSNSNNLRSFNPFPWLPMWMKYPAFSTDPDRNLEFMKTAAHELGHDVLHAIGGLFWSWRHEGTSTLFQATKPSAPVLPTAPAPINLMWYYNNGGDTTDYFDRVRASQSQIQGLVNHATFKFTIWWCPGAFGAPCISSGQCNSGICSWFRCVNCNSDSQCSPSQYCKGKYNPLVLNHCSSKRANGKLCSRNAMCISNKCDGGQCVECEIDSHCPSGHYCKWNNVPLVLNQCKAKKSNGAWCLQNRECTSNKCDGARCVECEQDSHCPSGQWCKNKNLPLILNDCVNKLGNGGWCVRDSQCASGHCDGLRCAECEHDGHCPSNKYCKYKNLPLVVNRCATRKCRGFCTRDRMCKSNKCRIWLACKKC